MKSILISLFNSGFFKETAQRFLAKSPKYFKIIQIIGAVCAAICGLPAFLEAHQISIPEAWQAIESTAVAWAGVGVLLASSLSVANATTLATQTGALPFTENNPVDKMESIQSVSAQKRKTAKVIHTGHSKGA